MTPAASAGGLCRRSTTQIPSVLAANASDWSGVTTTSKLTLDVDIGIVATLASVAAFCTRTALVSFATTYRLESMVPGQGGEKIRSIPLVRPIAFTATARKW